MPDAERLEIVASTRVTPAMWSDLEAIASQDNRRVADVIRIMLGSAIRQHKSKTGAKVRK